MMNNIDREYEGAWRRPQPGATGVSYWKSRGWCEFEARAFKYITLEAISDSPYLQKMISDRMTRFKRAQRDGLTNREYYFRIRQKYYIENGLTNNIRLLRNDKIGRTLAFDLFNLYKDAYAPRDTSGKPIGTPRPKGKTTQKVGTTKDRAVKTTQSEIKRLQDRLKYEKNEGARLSLQNQLNNQQRRLNSLNSQMD